MSHIDQTISEAGIVPVIRLAHPQRDAAELAKALRGGGICVAEVTFRSAGADDAIGRMAQACPEMLVGAGTVLCRQQVDAAAAAGARFIVTPGFDPELVAYCLEKWLAIYPGCSSATDYHAAHRFGLKVIKFFPAEQSGGLAKIKALSAPFPMFRVMPTGGISLQNLRQYLACPVVCACGGSYMVRDDLIEHQRWKEITALCRQSADVVKEVRGSWEK